MKTEIKQIITIVAFDEGDGLRIASTCGHGPAESLYDAISMVIDAFAKGGDSEALALGSMIASNMRMAIEVMAKARVKNARDSCEDDASIDVENARDAAGD